MGATCCTSNIPDQEEPYHLRYMEDMEKRQPLFNHNQGVMWSASSERTSKWNPRSNNSKNSTKDLSMTVREMNETVKVVKKANDEQMSAFDQELLEFLRAKE